MIILDTACLSSVNRERILESSKLRQNIEQFPPDKLFTTIITFEEQMRGWLALIAKSRNSEQEIFAYQRLHRSLETYRNTNVLDFDENAAKIFHNLKSQKIRIGTMDLKIASIISANEAILVSRNIKDFEQMLDYTIQYRN